MNLAPPVHAQVEASAALSCRGLVKRYGDVLAVDGLDLEVRPGECFGLLGPNGAGKTTTIEILEGLLAADAGEVQVLGMRWDRDATRLRQRLGIQLQETQLNDKLTVEEILRLFRSFYAQGPTVGELVASVGLETKRTAWYSKLSGGRSSAWPSPARSPATPTCCFSTSRRPGSTRSRGARSGTCCAGSSSEGRTILLTTHYMDEAQALCDRVAIVDRGRVIAQGTPLALIASLGAEHVVSFELRDGIALPAEAVLLGLPGVRRASLQAAGGTLIVSHLHEALPALLRAVDAPDAFTLLTTHSATLEDVFVSLTGRQLREE